MITILTGGRWTLIVVLTCISLMTSDLEHLFTGLLAICKSSLEKYLFKSSVLLKVGLLLFFNWVVWFLYVIWLLTPYWIYYVQVSLPFCRLPFSFGDGLLCCAKAFQFNVVPLVYFCFFCSYPRKQTQKNIAKTDLRVLLGLNFLLGILWFLGLTFKSLIHLEFIFVYSVRKWSRFILLYVVVQFSQQHLLKRLSLPYCMFLLPLLKSNRPFKCGFISGLSVVLCSVDLCVHFCSSTMMFWLLL